MKILIAAFAASTLLFPYLYLNYDIYSQCQDYFQEIKQSPITKVVCLGVLVFFLILFGYQILNNQEEKEKYYCKQVKKEEFETFCNDATQKALVELQKNPKYQEMLKKKGEDTAQWNWQVRERLQKAKFGVISSQSIDSKSEDSD